MRTAVAAGILTDLSRRAHPMFTRENLHFSFILHPYFTTRSPEKRIFHSRGSHWIGSPLKRSLWR